MATLAGPSVVMAAGMGSDRSIVEEIRGHLATVLYTAEGAVIQPRGIDSRKDPIQIRRTRRGSEEDHWANLERARNRTPDNCSCPVDVG